MLNDRDSFSDLTAKDIMTKSKINSIYRYGRRCIEYLGRFSITQLVVVDEGVYQRVLHLHDILKEGIL
jgi:arabinose-5-phosphate isomerase